MVIESQAALPSPRLVRSWVIGILGSWICVWICGPWIVNSILVRVRDSELDSVTLRAGDTIRWRSEGWATTLVGPHGLPGWKPNLAEKRIAIWGDSQVEGLCVNDAEKIGNQIIQLAAGQGRSIDCIPLGRSGSDAIDWLAKMPSADDLWHPVAHVWIITELADLLAFGSTSDHFGLVDRWQAESPPPVRWAKSVHAEAAFQAIRKLALDPASGGIRSLRWHVGGLDLATPASSQSNNATIDDAVLRLVATRLQALGEQYAGRFYIVYAPAVPRLGGGIEYIHPDDAAWNKLVHMTSSNGMNSQASQPFAPSPSPLSTAETGPRDSVTFVDLRQRFIDHWKLNTTLPRGFQNGLPGFGHLNSHGNRLIAEAVGAIDL